jgi:hypothetical protein
MEINYDFMADLARDYEYQYQVEELYGNLVANKLSQEFDIHVAFDERSKYFICDSIGFNIRFYDVKDFKQLHDMIEEQIGDDVEDAKLYELFNYFFDQVSVESKVGEFRDYSRTRMVSPFSSNTFFTLLWYIKTDKMMNNYSIGSDLMNVAQNYADKYPNDNATYFYPRSGLQYQVRYGSWIDMTTVDPKFSGWQIKFFQNGKVQMKGISDKDWDKIIHLDEICSRK